MKMCPLNRGVRSWGVSVNRDFTVIEFCESRNDV
jgi:hypothetical protein